MWIYAIYIGLHFLSQAKAIADTELFRPATSIVEEVELQLPKEQRFLKQKRAVVKRAVNLYRSRMRPQEPIDIDFEVSIFIVIFNPPTLNHISTLCYHIELIINNLSL